MPHQSTTVENIHFFGMTGMEFASPTDIHPIYKVYIR